MNTKKNKIKLSVILPAYKTEERLLKRAINPILEDVIGDLELFIVNDGADPGVKSIVESYKDKRIKYYETAKAHGGPAKARNIALREATGEYLYFHDHDDFLINNGYTKNALEKMYLAAKNDKADILFFDILDAANPMAKINFHDFDLKRSKSIEKLLAKKTPEEIGKHYEIFFKEGMFSLWNKIIKRSLLTDNNLKFNEKLIMLDDFDMFFKIIFLANKISQICEPCPLYYYDRGIDGSITNKKMRCEDNYYKDVQTVANLVELLKSYGIFEPLKVPMANHVIKQWVITCNFRCPGISPIKMKKYVRKYINMLEITEHDFEQLDNYTKGAYLYFA